MHHGVVALHMHQALVPQPVEQFVPVRGGKLSALRLEDRALFQVDCAADEAVPLFQE